MIFHFSFLTGGRRGIQTPDTPKGMLDFESSAIDHSAILPYKLSAHKIFLKIAEILELPFLILIVI